MKHGLKESHTQSLATERRLVGEQVKLLQRLDCCGRLDYMVQVGLGFDMVMVIT